MWKNLSPKAFALLRCYMSQTVAAYRRFGHSNGTNLKDLLSPIDHSSVSLFNLFVLSVPPSSHSHLRSPVSSCLYSFFFCSSCMSFLLLRCFPFFSLSNSIFPYIFGCQSSTNIDISAFVNVKDCQPIVRQKCRVVSKYKRNHKSVTTIGCKRCVKCCGYFNSKF